VVGWKVRTARPGYKLRYEFGLLQKIYPTSTLASVSSAIQKEKADLISLSESGNEITLAYAAPKASKSNKAGVQCNCKSCDSRSCRCFKNGLGCYCHSDGHDCGNMMPAALDQDQSAASEGGNEDEPAPVQPVPPLRTLRVQPVLARIVNRNAFGRADQLVPAHQKPSYSSIFQFSHPLPPHHTAHSAQKQ